MVEPVRSEAASEIGTAVLAYLRDHPGAADTLDGIVEWWLPRQRYEIERSRIRDALATLVASGALRRQRLPGGETLYALSNPRGATPLN